MDLLVEQAEQLVDDVTQEEHLGEQLVQSKVEGSWKKAVLQVQAGADERLSEQVVQLSEVV